VKHLAEQCQGEELLVVFGINQIATLKIMAQTFRYGDPSFAGSLAGIPLGIKSYHILELVEFIPEEVWSQEMEMYELEIEEEEQEDIRKVMEASRA
jgi:betaine reductase